MVFAFLCHSVLSDPCRVLFSTVFGREPAKHGEVGIHQIQVWCGAARRTHILYVRPFPKLCVNTELHYLHITCLQVFQWRPDGETLCAAAASTTQHFTSLFNSLSLPLPLPFIRTPLYHTYLNFDHITWNTHTHTHTHTPGLIHGLGFYRHCYCERKAEDSASHGSRESASRVQVSPRSSHCRERVREQSAVRNTACTQTYHIVGPMPGNPALHSIRHSPVSLV